MLFKRKTRPAVEPCVEPSEIERRVSIIHDGRWTRAGQYEPRRMSSIYLPRQAEKYLLADFRQFLSLADWYAEKSIPLRRGYCFHGPSGTGKDVTARAIATELELDIAVLNLANPEVSSRNIVTLLRGCPDGLLIVEGADRPNPELSLHLLEGPLDGVAGEHGLIVIFIVHDATKLPIELVRPGRIDISYEFTHASKDQVGRIFDVFFPDAADAARAVFIGECLEKQLTMAAVQGLLMAKSRETINKEITLNGQLARANERAGTQGDGRHRQVSSAQE